MKLDINNTTAPEHKTNINRFHKRKCEENQILKGNRMAIYPKLFACF